MTYALSFTYDLFEELKRGELTSVRLPCRESETLKEEDLLAQLSPFSAAERVEIYRYGRRELFEGKWLVATCGKLNGKVLVRRIQQVNLQDMNSHDAQNCGFYRVLDYKKYWDSLYTAPKFKWESNPLVWKLDIVYYTFLFTTVPLSPDVPESSQA